MSSENRGSGLGALMALAGSYLDVDGLTERTIAPPALVAGEHLPLGATRTAWTTFVQRSLVSVSSYIDARLRKRYAVPFTSPAPEIVCRWLVAIVTPMLYQRRGWDPSDEQAAAVIAEATAAKEELLEAANSETGLYDLPLRQDNVASAIAAPGPLSYSESSPYGWIDAQDQAVRGSS